MNMSPLKTFDELNKKISEIFLNNQEYVQLNTDINLLFDKKFKKIFKNQQAYRSPHTLKADYEKLFKEFNILAQKTRQALKSTKIIREEINSVLNSQVSNQQPDKRRELTLLNTLIEPSEISPLIKNQRFDDIDSTIKKIYSSIKQLNDIPFKTLKNNIYEYEDENLWEECILKNTIQSYETYLRKNPKGIQGKYFNEAKNRIKEASNTNKKNKMDKLYGAIISLILIILSYYTIPMFFDKELFNLIKIKNNIISNQWKWITIAPIYLIFLYYTLQKLFAQGIKNINILNIIVISSIGVVIFIIKNNFLN